MRVTNGLSSFLGSLFFSIILLILSFTVSSLSLPTKSWATEKANGKDLFIQHCSGCHINGGNIIRRSKTLKIKALNRNGINNPDAIAKIARSGIGIMSGYENVLGENGDQVVANWIWKQAQNAWVQG